MASSSPFSSSESLSNMNNKETEENKFQLKSRFQAERLDRIEQNKYIADLFNKVKNKISIENQESYNPESTYKKNYEKIAFLTRKYTNKSGGRKKKYKLKTKKNKKYKSK